VDKSQGLRPETFLELRAYWKIVVNIWIDVIASIGSKLRVSTSLAGGEGAARRAHVMAFPGKPPTCAERSFTSDSAHVPSNGAWRSMYYSSEPRIEIIKAAGIRVNGCRMVARNWRASARRLALITHGQTGKPPRPEPELPTSAACRWIQKSIWATALVPRTRFPTERYPTTARTRISLRDSQTSLDRSRLICRLR